MIAVNTQSIRCACRWLIAIVMAVQLGACAMAPGMRFKPDAPVDMSDPQPVPMVRNVTPVLVNEMKRARDQEFGAVKALFAQSVPYRIGVGDVLSVIAWDHPELVVPNLTYSVGETAGTMPVGPGLSGQTVPGFLVGSNGRIQYPYVGSIVAAGATPEELQASLNRALTPYLRNPQFTVTVVAYRSQRIFVDGSVGQPGVKPITNVPMTLPEAIAESNGVLAGVGDASRIQLTRDGQSVRLDLPGLVQAGVDVAAITLRNGDVLRVPPQTYNQVLVTGEVVKPVPVPMHDGHLTLNEALAAASGVNPASAEPAAIYIVRASKDAAQPLVFRLDASSPVGLALAEHFELEPKDVVYVDATGLTRWSRVMSLLLPGVQGVNVGRQAVGGY
jgi:polysaccharide export outer membrane protein